MTVLHLISSAGYYGAENMVVALAGGLSKLGCRSIVAAFRDSRCAHTEVADRAKDQGLATEIVPCRGRWDSHAVNRIQKLLDCHRVNVLHTHGYKADVLGCAAAWLQRTTVVATCHNWPDRSPIMRAYALLDRLLLKRFDEVAAASEPLARVLRQCGMSGAQGLPNGIDIERFALAAPTIRSQIPAGCNRLVGFIGRMVPEKGGTVLIRCAKTVLAARPRTAFIFVGDGPCRTQWAGLASQLGISPNVVFAGQRDDMPGVYASLDILILPSFNEATPMCLLEAQAARVPVIASCVGSVPKVVIPGVTGLLVDPADEDGLAAGILRLLADPDLARVMGEQGHEHVARHFSAASAAAAYLELYEQALARHCAHHERN